MITDIQLADDLRDFYLRSHRVVDRIMKAEGVSLARCKLLSFIRRAQSARSADVAAMFGYSPRTVTEAIDSLERDGLVTRIPDNNDRRAKIIVITPEGEAALAASEPARDRFLKGVFGTLSQEERKQLSAILGKMNLSLERLDG